MARRGMHPLGVVHVLDGQVRRLQSQFEATAGLALSAATGVDMGVDPAALGGFVTRAARVSSCFTGLGAPVQPMSARR